MTTLQASDEFFRAPPSAAAATGPASLPLRPPSVCNICMLFSSLTLSKKKVTGHSYVKFYDLQLLFGPFIDISCSRDISEKQFLGVFFLQN